MAADDELIKLIKELMSKPEQIRNICTSAHIDHGKCIKGSSRLILNNGEILTAEQLFSLAQDKGIKFEEKEDQVIYDIRNLNINVPSLNKETGKIEKKQLELAWKLKGGKLIKAKLRNNFEIATTPEHKFVVLDNLEFVKKEAKELKLGERVICPRNIEFESDLKIKEEILLKLKEKRFYIKLKQEFAEKLKNLIFNKKIKSVIKEINSELKYKSFYHGLWQNRFLLKDLINLAKLFEINLEEIYNNIDLLTFRNGAQKGKSSLPIKLPENFENFYYLAGLLIGDGHHKKFIVGKPSLGKKFEELCKEIGINVTFRNYDRTPEIVSNLTLVEVLNSLFDYPKKHKSHNVKISNFVLRSPKEYSSKLLRGYFDTDGSVEKSRRAVTISSASNQMIQDLSLFLLRFNCMPIVEKDNTISLSGKSLINFRKEIGFGLEEKAEKALNFSKTVMGSFVSDIIPIQLDNGLIALHQNFRSGDIEKLLSFCKYSHIPLEKINKLMNEELAFIEVKSLEVIEEEYVYDFTVKDNHNFVAEGMFISNTTFSDNLLLGAGMISEELAGKACVLDFHEDEKERGITIDAANVSMVHRAFDGKPYLINLIDTPGHVDFGGDVTRAMRAIDGSVVLVDSVEGIMPQTETVIKQALRERVKPVLFINKVDRLIREVKLTPEKMQEKFLKIIADINKLIYRLAPEEFKEKWQVNVQEGSVAFGSAIHKWALSFPYMQTNNISFKNVIDAYTNEKHEELSKIAPLHRIILNMSIKHHPNPKEAQKYRVPKLWHGDFESIEGKSLLNCDPTGPTVFVVTKIVIDKHAGEIAAGRLFSGRVAHGQEVYLNGAKRIVRLQQISIYNGSKRVQIEEGLAGNVLGLVGLKDVFAGETVSSGPMQPFEAIKHIFEPVITKSIEAKKASDLPKLIEVLKQVNKEDPGIVIEINEETGENLISGMGELHLEVIENRIRTEKGLEITTSPPIVVFRETVLKRSLEVEGKSPNKHNKFYIIVEPLENAIYDAIKAGEIEETRMKKKEQELVDIFVKYGMDPKEARKVREVFNGNILVDQTRGIVHIGEVIEMVMDGFEQVMKEGPLAREPCTKLRVNLMDTKLHEDAIHRGPAQVLPSVRESLKGAIMQGNPVIYEPLQILQLEAPSQFLSDVTKLVQNKRGQILEIEQELDHTVMKAKLPVAEMFGLASDLRGATGGRGQQSLIDQVFEKLPNELQQKIIKQIRERKGLKIDQDQV